MPGRATDQRVEPRSHLGHLERLGHVVVSAGVQALDPFGPGAASGQHQDGMVTTNGPPAPEDAQAGIMPRSCMRLTSSRFDVVTELRVQEFEFGQGQPGVVSGPVHFLSTVIGVVTSGGFSPGSATAAAPGALMHKI